jgi:hypothetical protein
MVQWCNEKTIETGGKYGIGSGVVPVLSGTCTSGCPLTIQREMWKVDYLVEPPV